MSELVPWATVARLRRERSATEVRLKPDASEMIERAKLDKRDPIAKARALIAAYENETGIPLNRKG